MPDFGSSFPLDVLETVRNFLSRQLIDEARLFVGAGKKYGSLGWVRTKLAFSNFGAKSIRRRSLVEVSDKVV